MIIRTIPRVVLCLLARERYQSSFFRRRIKQSSKPDRLGRLGPTREVRWFDIFMLVSHMYIHLCATVYTPSSQRGPP